MVQAWYMDSSEADQTLPHHLDPPEYVSLDELKKCAGILYWKIDVDRIKEEGKLQQIRKERNYTYEDLLELSPEKLPDYEAKLKIFFKEHLHADEEIRFVLQGSGYFDVRDDKDKWIRILVESGDLIVLPAGIYHRFTLDSKNYIKVMRLFVGDPVWTPVNRPADDHAARISYLKALTNGFEK